MRGTTIAILVAASIVAGASQSAAQAPDRDELARAEAAKRDAEVRRVQAETELVEAEARLARARKAEIEAEEELVRARTAELAAQLVQGGSPPSRPTHAEPPPPSPAMTDSHPVGGEEKLASLRANAYSLREIVAEMPLQHAGFDGFVHGSSGGEDTNRLDLEKLTGFFLDPRLLTGEGDLKYVVTPTRRLSFEALLRAPKLSETVRAAFDEPMETAALDGLDVTDDVTLSVTLNAGQYERKPKDEAERQARESIRAAMEAAPARTRAERVADRLLATRGDAAFLHSPEDLRELTSPMRVAATYREVQNELKLDVTASARTVDPLIAANEVSAALTATYGPKGDKATDVNRHSFAAEAAFVDRERLEVPEHPALDQPAYRQLAAKLNWSAKLNPKAAAERDKANTVDHSFTLSYLRPNEDFVNDRIVATEKIVFWLTNEMSIPVSLTWANREELVDEDEVRGHFGFSYSLPK